MPYTQRTPLEEAAYQLGVLDGMLIGKYRERQHILFELAQETKKQYDLLPANIKLREASEWPKLPRYAWDLPARNPDIHNDAVHPMDAVGDGEVADGSGDV